MPVDPEYSSTQIAMQWIVVILVAWRVLFRDAVSHAFHQHFRTTVAGSGGVIMADVASGIDAMTLRHIVSGAEIGLLVLARHSRRPRGAVRHAGLAECRGGRRALGSLPRTAGADGHRPCRLVRPSPRRGRGA
ncbi:hypothetical protein [Acidimangrovimonas sediminis]|uniref:hypothetical protein n=1 Tax=Acidimangrovimonas sediminis TaxID=2056283 RepID=UPI0011AFCBF0|nr:hypothetical protein [Acidimangrovimonas sediminis]